MIAATIRPGPGSRKVEARELAAAVRPGPRPRKVEARRRQKPAHVFEQRSRSPPEAGAAGRDSGLGHGCRRHAGLVARQGAWAAVRQGLVVEQAAVVEKGDAPVRGARLASDGSLGVFASRNARSVLAGEAPRLQVDRGGRHVQSVLGRRRVEVSQLGLHAEAQVPDEVLVAAPMFEDGRPPRLGRRRAVDRASWARVVLVPPLLHAPVPHEGSQHQGVRRGRGEEQLDRGVERPGLLAPAVPDDVRHAIDGDDDGGEAEREQEHELELELRPHGAAEDDGDGEEDQGQVRHDIADGHGQELRIPLATPSPWIRKHLPVVGEGLAFGQAANHDGGKGGDKEATEKDKGQVIGPSPVDVKPLEELENGVLEDP